MSECLRRPQLWEPVLLGEGEKAPFPWGPWARVDVARCLYARVAAAEACSARIEDGEVRYQLALFCHMHLPLWVYFDQTVAMRIPDLEEKVEQWEGWSAAQREGWSRARRMWPDPDFLFHEGELPDLVSSLAWLNFFSNVHTRIYPLWHILSKALPQPCQIRHMPKITVNYLKNDEAIYAFIIKVLWASLSGIYRTAHSRPPMAVLARLYHGMAGYQPRQILYDFIEYHPFIVFYALKDYIVHIMQYDPPLRKVICKKYEWESFEDNVHDTVDVMRERLAGLTPDLSAEARAAVWEDLERMLALDGNNQKKFLHRLIRNDVHVSMATHFCNVRDSQESPEEAQRQLTPESARHLADFVATLPVMPDINYYWLVHYGVSPDTIRTLNQIEEQYRSGVSDNVIKRTLANLRYKNPRDYDLSTHYLNLFALRHQIYSVPLPQHTVVEQYAALRQRCELHPESPLPPRAGIYYFCVKCRKIKANVIEPNGCCNKIYANGYKKVTYDHVTDRVYCARKVDKGRAGKAGAVLSSAPSARRRRRESVADQRVELIPVQMLGRIVWFFGKPYVLCTLCAGVMMYEFWKYHGSRMVCHSCGPYRKFTPGADRIALDNKPPPPPPVEAQIAANRDPSEVTAEEQEGPPSAEKHRLPFHFTERCWYCREHIQNKYNRHLALAIDDMFTMEIGFVGLCARHWTSHLLALADQEKLTTTAILRSLSKTPHLLPTVGLPKQK